MRGGCVTLRIYVPKLVAHGQRFANQHLVKSLQRHVQRSISVLDLLQELAALSHDLRDDILKQYFNSCIRFVTIRNI